jgi:hypothetical protein
MEQKGRLRRAIGEARLNTLEPTRSIRVNKLLFLNFRLLSEAVRDQKKGVRHLEPLIAKGNIIIAPPCNVMKIFQVPPHLKSWEEHKSRGGQGISGLNRLPGTCFH